MGYDFKMPLHTESYTNNSRQHGKIGNKVV